MSPSSKSSPAEKQTKHQLETVHTHERIPGHPNYYEKDGLRTYGDEADHDHEPPVRSASQLWARRSC